MLDPGRTPWAMGGVTSPEVEDYLYSLLPQRDPVLAEMEAEAAERKIPIVGPAVGRLFYLLAKISGARTVFEMGSAIGYSTIWWARALPEDGAVFYTDGDRKNAAEAQRYFSRAGVSARIQVNVGDAIELLSEQKQQFDIIFNDIDKEDYPRALRVALPRLRTNGLFVSDNVLWSGKVAKASSHDDSATRSIREFNRLLYQSPDFFTTVIPLRDGIAVALKS